MTDPLAFLTNAGDDWDIACAVVEEAREIQIKERQEEMKALVRGFSQAIGSVPIVRFG